jgi:hypothetical protein
MTQQMRQVDSVNLSDKYQEIQHLSENFISNRFICSLSLSRKCDLRVLPVSAARNFLPAPSGPAGFSLAEGGLF